MDRKCEKNSCYHETIQECLGLDEQVEKEYNCTQNVHTEIPCNDCQPKKSPELPRELPELPLETDEERDQFSSISINRRAINQLIRYLKAKE